MSVATLRLTKNGAGEVLHDPMASKVVAHEIAHLLGAQHDGVTPHDKECKAVFFSFRQNFYLCRVFTKATFPVLTPRI